MILTRYLRRLLRNLLSILHKIELLISVVSIIVVLFIVLRGSDVSFIEVAKSLPVVALFLVGCSLFLMHLVRRRISSGIVRIRSKWSVDEFKEELKECEGTYLFVGNSFKPHLEAFIKGYAQDAGRRRKATLLLAPVETDAALAREHLEVIKALSDVGGVELRTMDRSRSWWMHAFNVELETRSAEEEGHTFIVLGLNPVANGGLPTVLELEKTNKRQGLFEHFINEARYLYSVGNIKDPESWQRDLERLSCSVSSSVR